MTGLFKACLGAAVALCLAQGAHALTQSFTDTFSGSRTSATLSVSQFDPSLGVLDSVLVTYSGHAEDHTSRTATCRYVSGYFNGSRYVPGRTDCSGAMASATAHARITFTGPGVSDTAMGALNVMTCSSGFSLPCKVTATSSASLTSSARPMDFSAYVGTGTVDFSATGKLLKEASVTVTYSYSDPVAQQARTAGGASPVPLPAGTWLMLAGLGGLVTLRRPRRS